MLGLAACAGTPNGIEITLSPSVISSLDGTTEVSALVAADSTPISDAAVAMTVTYTDRNGTTHDVPATKGKTDVRGVYHATLTGLTWEGTGSVTISDGKLTGTATFAVLDRTPPKVTILPPTSDLKVGPGLPLDVQVHVTDEIGVSQVYFDGTNNINNGQRSTVIASGAPDVTVTFHTNVPQGAMNGQTIELHALASDLSGNLAAAPPVTLTVDSSISIATAGGLSGSLLTDGTATQLVNPRAIALSSKDGKLYVADQAGTGVCNPSCVWQVDATTGAVTSTPVVVGLGQIEEVAFDATADNMYISDRQSRVVQLAWNGTNAYVTQTVCDNLAQNPPQDPYHLVIDATLGILVVDGNQKEVYQAALPCAATTTATQLTNNSNFDSPRGMAAGAAGEFYVSDNNRNEVFKMTSTGTLSQFQGGIEAPYGMEWLAGGTTQFANTLMVAATGNRTVVSTTGNGTVAAVYLRNGPIDLTVASGTMYIVTEPGNNIRGRIYKVTGF
ncbi:MAG: hypothetical protein ACM31C_30090 [Acidobacteriota bacterium]